MMKEFLEEYLFPFVLLIALTGGLIWYFIYEHKRSTSYVECMQTCKPQKADVIEGKCHCQTDQGWIKK